MPTVTPEEIKAAQAKADTYEFPVTHPAAKAARVHFETALGASDITRMVQAFNDLYKHAGAMEGVVKELCSLYSERAQPDMQPLERVATAAIRLAEQVVAAHGIEGKG